MDIKTKKQYYVRVAIGQTIGIFGKVYANNDVMDLTSEEVASPGIQGFIDKGLVIPASRRPPPRSIVCFRGGGRGDLLMTLPAIRYLQRKYPEARITYILPDYLAAVIDGLHIVDSVIIQDLSDGEFTELSHQYDLAWHFTHEAVWTTGQHIIDHYLQKVGSQELGDRNLMVDIEAIELPLACPEPYVCLHVRSEYQCKNWGSQAQWDVIVESLAQYTVIQIGSDDQPDLGVIQASKYRLSPIQTMRLLQGAEFLIGIDSFPIHAARAVGCKTIAIYGGASCPRTCGYEDNVNVVSRMECACSGSMGLARRCPKQYACMDYIDAADVIEAWGQRYGIQG